MRDWDWLRPHTLNLYEYVGNDPVNAWDPTGLNSILEIMFRQEDMEILNAVGTEKEQETKDRIIAKRHARGVVGEKAYDIISGAMSGGSAPIIKTAVKNKVKREVTKYGANKLKNKLLSNKDALPGNKKPEVKIVEGSTQKNDNFDINKVGSRPTDKMTASKAENKHKDQNFINDLQRGKQAGEKPVPRTKGQKVVEFFRPFVNWLGNLGKN